MTVAELMSRMSSAEFSEWMAYDRIEPFGEQRADLRMGILASTAANINRGKDSTPFKPEDFMPFVEKTPRKNKNLAHQLSALFAPMIKD